MNRSDFDPEIVIDTRYSVVGRVATEVASRALDGDKVAVVNAESAVITGGKEDVLERFRKRQSLGSDSGPNHPRRPDGIFKRAIRGMLPMNSTRGRDSFRNIRVYVGNPFEEVEATVLEDATIDRLSTIRFVELGDISTQLGAKPTW